MQDQTETQMLPSASRPRTGRRFMTGLVLLLLLGLALAAWLIWRGSLDIPGLTSSTGPQPARKAPIAALPSAAPKQAPVTPQSTATPALPIGTVEARLALLEERMSRLDLQATAASGNAARAEGLLIAFAARRLIDRGAQLGYLEDQLKLRFADAQPNAVRIIIEAGRSPVTLDRLMAQLDTLAPKLEIPTKTDSAWTRAKREIAELFVIRHEATPLVSAEERIQRAKLLLTAGRADDAVNEVQRLPGAEDARDWIEAVQRYDRVQRALDLIETTAMLDPRNLQDSQGKHVEQPSPLAEPTGTAAPAPVASPATRPAN